ncbi:hypothetical protein PMAYCL1PPCAC_01831 [Pristionchus mayeri]|uniref:Uncharacterized protein n=1 Tax=Pristionchus mayeri TaxID=1317129 RepID=A0AAN4Z0N1_9BILA|nr:hypothetical protein PMAYCL1PPCAC_01831 [Pristionchus mayeri]
MKLLRFDSLNYGVIEIDDGPNGFTTRNDRMPRSFSFESPNVTLTYIPAPSNGDSFSLTMKLIERQEDCICPHQPHITSNISIEIAPHCTQLDCLYLLPELDDQTAKYRVESDYSDDDITSRKYLLSQDRDTFVC